MQSQFERDAQCAAVRAVESRLAHNENVRKRALRRRVFASLGAWIGGLVILAVIGGYFHMRSTGDLSLKGLLGLEDKILALASSQSSSDVASATRISVADEKWRTHYAEVVTLFTRGNLAPWSDAPASVRPKNAPSGTCYHILIPRTEGFALYEMRSGESITELSPFAPPIVLKRDEFKKAREGKSFLIACEGRVYVSDGGELKKWDTFRHNLIPQ